MSEDSEQGETERHECPVHGSYRARKKKISSRPPRFVWTFCPACEEQWEANEQYLASLIPARWE